MNLGLEQIGFGLLSGCLLASALLTTQARTAIHGVLWLGVTLSATAVLYVMLEAPLLAGVQILLYVGGVMTLMILAVMLTRPDGKDSLDQTEQVRAGLLALVAFGLLTSSVRHTPPLPAVTTPPPDTAVLGKVLMTEHALSFEVLSLLLLAVMIGAIVLTRRSGPGLSPPRVLKEGGR